MTGREMMDLGLVHIPTRAVNMDSTEFINSLRVGARAIRVHPW